MVARGCGCGRGIDSLGGSGMKAPLDLEEGETVGRLKERGEWGG